MFFFRFFSRLADYPFEQFEKLVVGLFNLPGAPLVFRKQPAQSPFWIVGCFCHGRKRIAEVD